ncbi:MAG TPA: AAA family ATPase [Sedimentisphaerales bacterium]|nr:AAA family ATPase [Sedimentisphaerales bacterium]
MTKNLGDTVGRSAPTRIEWLRVKNYRALQNVEFKEITPLMVLLGPNGSGKSTVFDVFNFLSECFQFGLRHAWDRRGRARELKTRGQDGPLVIEIKYRERPRQPLITYHLAIDEGSKGPYVADEWLQWKRGQYGRPFRFLEYKQGQGRAASGETPDEQDERVEIPLRSADLIAVNTLGQFAEHPRVAALREFITDWYVSYLSIQDTRGQPEAGPQERLSKTGDNLPNVVQYLKEQHPERLERIFETLRRRVPRLERVEAEPMQDGRLLLQIKDAPFDQPIMSRYASDGTLKMLSYLIVLMDPNPPRFIGIEEPENFLHPRLLPELAEECRAASDTSQLLVTTP